jgi:helix-destabilizing protein
VRPQHINREHFMKLEIQIEIKSTDIEDKRGISRAGKPYHIREQFGYADLGKEYPVEIRVPLDPTAPPYAVGNYSIHPDSLYVDRFGRLTLGRLKLIPAGAKRQAAA